MTPRLICLAFLLAAAGCNRPFTPTANPTRIPSSRYKRVFAAAVHVLRDKGFTVNRQDYRFGRITSRPLNSPTVFEPWRPLNTTGQQALQSTVDDLRRTVTVFLNPVKNPTSKDSASPPDYLLRVEVLLEDHQLPTRRLVNAARGGLSKLSAVPTEWQRRGITGGYWLPLRRDPYLEDRLLHDILTRSGVARDEHKTERHKRGAADAKRPRGERPRDRQVTPPGAQER